MKLLDYQYALIEVCGVIRSNMVCTFSHSTAPISSFFVVCILSYLFCTHCKSLYTVKFCLPFVCQRMPFSFLLPKPFQLCRLTDNFANSVDPNETACNKPSHLDLFCLPFCSWFLTDTPVYNSQCVQNLILSPLVGTQTRPDLLSGLIWIQTVWH